MLGRATAEIPLKHLKQGENMVQFAAGKQIAYGFNWGFYWIYSFTIRVYCDSSVPAPAGRILAPAAGETVAENPQIEAEAWSPNGAIRQVDFLGEYEDFNWEGDGVFHQWHYVSRKGVLDKHIGTASQPPYRTVWDTRWIPDQSGPIRLMARIVDESGMCSMTPAVEGVALAREKRRVRMFQADNFPENFAARAGKRLVCPIVIEGGLDEARAAKLVLSTWSAATDTGETHEIGLNGHRIADNFGRFHDHSFDQLDVPLETLKEGENELHIYSVYKGHGLEINWPGPVLLIEYAKQ
ncbi:MAG: hypothetical protein BWZ10_00720 [candidate division BRC1 bacterium ADurb.BinA364]|nr:MAG: hypothetical protein BWZ10_00720 [candidate division BRC1 bacterium ADurb.BinA364]